MKYWDDARQAAAAAREGFRVVGSRGYMLTSVRRTLSFLLVAAFAHTARAQENTRAHSAIAIGPSIALGAGAIGGVHLQLTAETPWPLHQSARRRPRAGNCHGIGRPVMRPRDAAV